MIEIDYDLIPLPRERQVEIARDARTLASRGKVPPIGPADHGRLVVVNPNQGFTIHHVPDDLRKPLRRQMLPVYDGSNALPGEALLRRLLEQSEEPLRAVVIELHSQFPTAGEFVARLPELRAAHPDCRFLLHGDLNRVTTLLQQLMTGGQAVCRLGFHAYDGSIDLSGPEALANLLVDLPKYPTFSTPFFESLRIRIGNRSDWFDLAALKRLYRLFGVGNIGELDVSGKLKDRLITVDLPLPVLEAVRFRKERGEAFQGIRLDGAKVPSARFTEQRMDGKAIPFNEIEAFYRRLPGRDEEEIALDRVRALRVNCFEGHVSFLWKPSEHYIPLYEVNSLRWSPDGGSGDDGASTAPRGVEFECVVVTEPGRPRFGDVRAGVRRLFLERVYVESLSKQAKLKEYASHLKIACLGPISAQTFKLLKPFGLSRFLPTDRQYYLCDSVEQLTDYHGFDARLEASYGELLETLKTLFAEGADRAFDPEHIQHRLPLVLEWARGKAPPWARVSAEHLSSLYNELRVFMKFSEAEFRRVAHPGMDYGGYFAKLNACRGAGLLAKRLASVKSGVYGRLFGADEAPDFVFFATGQELTQNRERFFLPGLAWPEIFGAAGAGGLAWEADYGFTVFLDEQLAIIESLWRQEHEEHPGPAYYDEYFTTRLREGEREIEELRRLSDPGAVRGTPPYQAACKRLEAEHRAEREQFEQELATEAALLQKAEQAYFAALAQFSRHLASDFRPELLLGSEDYIHALDALIQGRSTEILIRLREAITRTIRQVNHDLEELRETLKAYMAAHSRLQQAVVPFLQSRSRHHTRDQALTQTEALLERLNAQQRLAPNELEAARQNLHSRRVVLKEEQGKLEQELQQIAAKSRAEANRVREQISRVLAAISRRGGVDSGKASQIGMIRALEEAVIQANRELGEIMRSTRDTQRALFEAARLCFRRRGENAIGLYEADNELAALESRREQGMLQRMMAKKITAPLVPLQLPPPPGPEPALQAEYEESLAEWERCGERLSQVGQVERFLAEVRKPIAEYQALQKSVAAFKQAVDDKSKHQRSVEAIQHHVERLKREARDLPRLIDERLLPAFRVLCDQHLVPGTVARMEDFRRAQAFVREAGKLSFETVQREFLDHAVFRRFQAAQFRAGAFYGQNPDHPLFAHLSNVLPALYGFHRQVKANLRRLGLRDDEITLTKLPMASPGEIRRFCEQVLREDPRTRHTYLVLPGTLSLREALGIIAHKETIFSGLPQLVLIFISKFDPDEVLRDADLREQYFRAVKHNVIIHIGAPSLVDNPGPISVRLAQETIGRAFDLSRVEPMPEQDSRPAPA
jgi:hypothetical protein